MNAVVANSFFYDRNTDHQSLSWYRLCYLESVVRYLSYACSKIAHLPQVSEQFSNFTSLDPEHHRSDTWLYVHLFVMLVDTTVHL